ncbi:MAG TPA: hypothetical protein DCO83_15825 [Mucilaginibacter sp.]|nr:hypothetical protein [Mucilaginibacter sp.]
MHEKSPAFWENMFYICIKHKHYQLKDMAKPIKETPILRGKDAVKFNKEMEKSKSEIVPIAVRERMKSNYSQLQAIAKF